MAEEEASYEVVPAVAGGAPVAAQGWGDEPSLAPARSPLERPIAAIRRYKWLLLGTVALAVLGGVVATRLVQPEYEVRATIWINSETPLQEQAGPIRSHELLNAAAWVELIKSYRIADAVVRKLALYVKPKHVADSAMFSNFTVADRFVPGTYTLDVEKDGRRWTLSLIDAPFTESGAAGDSIGRKVGLRWQPSAATLSRFSNKKVDFTVATPRETSIELMKRLDARLPERSPMLGLTLQDPNPQLAARTLNTWVEEYVAVAGELKRRNLVEFANILGGQLSFAENSLRSAEAALEGFRIHTITLPAEGGPVQPGVEMSRDPVLKSYFDRKIEYDNLRNDREALERVLANAQNGTVPYESLLLIPSVSNNPGASGLRSSFEELNKRQSELNAARQIYTDAFPQVRDLAGVVQTLKTKTIPAQANALLTQLREREGDYDRRIRGASSDLQQIPARTIEEMRLRRAVAVSEGLYTTLKSRYAEAKLAEASATPDVNIMDSAIAPLNPTKNTTPRIMLMAVLGGLAAAVALALLLDKIDGRIRYPDQATNELGLPIAATVPLFPKGNGGHHSTEQVSQLVESFRTLRMNVLNSAGGRVTLAVSSPSPGDGKSFISSNLAMSFADAGFRTLLVDGDTRRGILHEIFGLPRTSGLTDYLAGHVDQQAIIHATNHDKLSIIPSGNPRKRSPELLTSPLLGRLIADLKARYDVVIFDTPPLAAGIDGYAIAAATGSLLVVIRIGQTAKRMAAAKLLLVDRLPISVVGTVLNAVPSTGEYEYYGYVSGYGTEDLEPGKQVAQIS
ncbi:MAG: polysaccharide biosynthesis tyrosine autokinase [Gemmatimonadaceae bacterium]|nr:polysaccharide biosynthesis tyrosine autokinase [Gemmatimonadaceae bacterium]NUO96252.1 polysaccharide biosynthesis tyrosine autokinase [Gemmatimonadaceae bacterium]NUP70445.1 polysaccharide biosynthesis tyrosine autokinase [Gemmatimonadaceae bacterium]NUR33080.1 polysaccharide biosynthesis tyrosine autokinase [Gemmatimonadaceae bacterium]NUS32062.1 polysaccharide biosynthesis tyrosine autokinase [Gemmatimonadaceae bacterium]